MMAFVLLIVLSSNLTVPMGIYPSNAEGELRCHAEAAEVKRYVAMQEYRCERMKLEPVHE